MPRSLVLCSGGIKSALLLATARKEGSVVALFLDYGQANCEYEFESARKLSDFYDAKLITYDIESLPIPEDPLLRFLCFALYGVKFARRECCDIVYHGLAMEDALARMLPNVEIFMQGFKELVKVALPRYDDDGHWLGSVEVETPLRRLRLAHIVRLGCEYYVPWVLARSCEQDSLLPCGTCAKCKERDKTFKKLEIGELYVY